MDKTYKLKVAGLERELNICKLNDAISIAGFIMFSDVPLVEACAKELLKKVPEFDCILTAESKGIPLAYEMSRLSGKQYYVARKKLKAYMKEPVVVNVQSITTVGVQTLILDKTYIDEMKGKRLLIVDDVVSTGESLRALEELVSHTEAKLVGKAFVLAEDAASDRKDIIYLEKLPIFPNK